MLRKRQRWLRQEAGSANGSHNSANGSCMLPLFEAGARSRLSGAGSPGEASDAEGIGAATSTGRIAWKPLHEMRPTAKPSGEGVLCFSKTKDDCGRRHHETAYRMRMHVLHTKKLGQFSVVALALQHAYFFSLQQSHLTRLPLVERPPSFLSGEFQSVPRCLFCVGGAQDGCQAAAGRQQLRDFQ